MIAVHEEKKEAATPAPALTNENISSPLTGTVKPLSEISDEVFSTGAMGKGVAIVPEDGKLLSPFNGTIANAFRTGHAIGIVSDGGTEILVHIGMDTVKLKGQHFKTHISEGDRVTKGQLLVEFDIGAIKALGYDMTTPIIVTNTAEYSDVKVLGNNRVYTGDSLLEVKL